MNGRTEPPAAFRPATPPGSQPFDPVRLCIYATIAALSWLVTPWAMVSVFSGIALVVYFRARRNGLVRSRCKLGDTRLVMAYLGLLFLAGVAYTTHRVFGLF